MNASIEEIADIAGRCRLNLIQLHGDESPRYCDALIERLGLPIIKAFTSSQLDRLDDIDRYTRASFFLFDLDKRVDPASANGTRDTLWREAAAIRARGYRIFLGGGLDFTNVGDAMNRVAPYCIDVASSVEREPGVKDSSALRSFVKEVKG